jgi:hypothetical protein
MQDPGRSGVALLCGWGRGRFGATFLRSWDRGRNQETDGCCDEVEAYFRGCTVIADNAFPLEYVRIPTCGSDAGKNLSTMQFCEFDCIYEQAVLFVPLLMPRK